MKTTPRIEVNGFGLNKEVASRLLEDAGLKADKKTIAALVSHAKDNHPKNEYLNRGELEAALKKLLDDRKPDIRPTQSLEKVLGSVPKSLSRYNINLFDTDGNNTKDMLTFDPVPLKKQTSGSPQLRALGGAKAKSVDQEVGHTWKGGVTVQFKSNGEAVPFNKGKWVTSSFSEMLLGRPDREDALARLKADGYNINAQRDFLVVNLKDHKEPIIFGLREGSDQKAKIEEKKQPAVGRMMMPQFNTDKRDYGFVSICTEVSVEHFGDQRLITVKKPVIYLYPEKKTTVSVHVQPNGAFAAQYPACQDGRWEMIATPEGTLFDPKTEKRYSYLFWEGTNPGALSIDEKRAFCVKAADAEKFLDDVAVRYALNDKERTDFVSYWIPALLRNPMSLVQFLEPPECAAYATLDVAPKPDAEIRLFMVFRRTDKLVKTGNPILPELRRGKFTVVEWGGANLDE